MSTNLKFAFPDIPFNASSGISSATYDTDFPVTNLVNGSRARIAKLASELIGMHQIEYDLGSGNEQSADYLALVDAKKLKASAVDYVRLRASDYTYQYPTSALAIFDFDRDVTFNSSRQISQVNDQSGNTNHATQSTDANKPVLSRADNKENFITSSDTAVSAFRATITLNTSDILAPDGTQTANKIVEDSTASNSHGYTKANASLSVISGTSYRIGIYAARLTGDRTFYINTNSPLGGAVVKWNPATGSLISSSGTSVSASNGVDVGGGWFYFSFTVTGQSTSTAATYILGMANSSGATSYNGDGASAIYTWRHVYQEAAADNDPIGTGTFQEIRGINGNRAAVFDGSNDYLLANGIADDVSGDDIPHTVIAVIKLARAATPNGTLINFGDSAQSTQKWHDYYMGSTYLAYRRGDTGGAVSTTAGTTTTNTAVLSYIFTGTNVSLYVNGSIVINNASLNVGTVTFNRVGIGAYVMSTLGDYFSGKIAFMAVMSSALGTSDRQAWEGYLTNRYSTAPIADIDLQNATLTGGQGKDYITTFTESDEFRYWILQFITNTESSKRPLSKAYFGKLLDLNRDPQLGLRASSLYHQDKAMHHKKGLSLSYKGITTTKRQEFETKIGQYKDTNEVLLHTTTYDAPLINSDLLSAEVKSANFQMHGASQNDLEIEIEETI